MAEVKGRTAISIDELVEASIIDGRVAPDGTLIFTTRGGAEILGGQVPVVPDFSPLTAWPVGSVFMHTTDTDPSLLLGGGTWVRWGQGKMPVSFDEGDADFDEVEATGGEKAHSLTKAETPAHVHAMTHQHAEGTFDYQHVNNSPGGGSGARISDIDNKTGGGGTVQTVTVDIPNYTGNTGGGTSDGLTAGSGAPHNNMPPYIVCYMWKRTA